MRRINSFVITKTEEDLPSIVRSSFDRGLIYPYPHVFIFKMDDSETEYNFVKMRPLGERCATVRDSRLNNIGVGIVVHGLQGDEMNEKMKTLVATVIKTIIDDMCIDNFSIVTDEVNPDKFVDIFGLKAKVSLIPSMFSSRLITK